MIQHLNKKQTNYPTKNKLINSSMKNRKFVTFPKLLRTTAHPTSKPNMNFKEQHFTLKNFPRPRDSIRKIHDIDRPPPPPPPPPPPSLTPANNVCVSRRTLYSPSQNQKPRRVRAATPRGLARPRTFLRLGQKYNGSGRVAKELRVERRAGIWERDENEKRRTSRRDTWGKGALIKQKPRTQRIKTERVHIRVEREKV